MSLGLWIITGSVLLVASEAIVSYFCEENFFPSQISKKWAMNGIPFAYHGGVWSDVLLLPPMMAYIVGNYGSSWTTEDVLKMGAAGVAVTLANHILLITTQPIPDSFGWKKNKWDAVIAFHFVYMSVYVALAGLFFFYSKGVSTAAAVTVAIVLGIHTAFGTHVPLGMLQRHKRYMWCPDFLSSPQLPWLSLAIWTTLSILAAAAAGMVAALLVVAIGAFLALWVVAFLIVSPPALRT